MCRVGVWVSAVQGLKQQLSAVQPPSVGQWYRFVRGKRDGQADEAKAVFLVDIGADAVEEKLLFIQHASVMQLY
eukprot:m.82542 g.82542  ORF g.82542 m.82542 type:complete len:74 (+) comp14924_c0_seq4:416-637(+)